MSPAKTRNGIRLAEVW